MWQTSPSKQHQFSPAGMEALGRWSVPSILVNLLQFICGFKLLLYVIPNSFYYEIRAQGKPYHLLLECLLFSLTMVLYNSGCVWGQTTELFLDWLSLLMHYMMNTNVKCLKLPKIYMYFLYIKLTYIFLHAISSVVTAATGLQHQLREGHKHGMSISRIQKTLAFGW